MSKLKPAPPPREQDFRRFAPPPPIYSDADRDIRFAEVMRILEERRRNRQTEIDTEENRKVGPVPSRLVWGYSAAILLFLATAAIFITQYRAAPEVLTGEFTGVTGRIFINRQQTESRIFAEKDRLRIPVGSSVAFNLGSENRFQLRAGEYYFNEYRPLRKSLLLDITSGDVTVFSTEKGNQKTVIFRTPHRDYKLTGTIARLRVSNSGNESLEVASGSISILGLNETVTGGQSATVVDGKIRIAELSNSRKSLLLRQGKEKSGGPIEKRPLFPGGRMGFVIDKNDPDKKDFGRIWNKGNRIFIQFESGKHRGLDPKKWRIEYVD